MRREVQLTRENVGFLLAKALQRWNELLRRRFAQEGFAEVRPQYGSVLIPLYEEDGLAIGELGRRARLSKQTMTTMIRQMERDGLVKRRPDSEDGRVSRVLLTGRARDFRSVAERVLLELDRALQRRFGGASRSAAQEFLRTVADLEL
jgi:DNA-binding MarR family transcriptional regulator